METPAEEIGNGPAQGNAPELRLTGCQFEKVIVQGQRRPHPITMLMEVFDFNKVDQTSISSKLMPYNPDWCIRHLPSFQQGGVISLRVGPEGCAVPQFRRVRGEGPSTKPNRVVWNRQNGGSGGPGRRFPTGPLTVHKAGAGPAQQKSAHR